MADGACQAATGLFLADMHCHLDFSPDPLALAREGRRCGTSFLSCTVSPQGYRRAKELLGAQPNVRVAAGLHPWWLADGRCGGADVDELESLAGSCRYVGEVGLDFSPRVLGPQPVPGARERQQHAFERICGSASRGGAQLISLHAVRASSEVLDILERTGAVKSCACILHWFSGTSDELTRARRLGCFFSVNPRMLESRRGCAYVQAMPRDRMLLETDLPEEGEACEPGLMPSLLNKALEGVCDLRGEDVREQVWETSHSLLV